jgi:very-short-patch-repair endonuclease
VGIADAAVAGLQQQFLDGVPHQHALSPQSSLYGNAKIRFNQNIVLREHFRCMPEIIQFSNDLCYASNGTPLDPLRAYPANRLEPLVLRHVPQGYRQGSTQYAQNPPEAEAIVEQLCACIDDPRYAGASMGVISLQGEAQAKLIESLLLRTLDPEVIEERRIICGDAYAFQGDERSVIFLSMVAAPGEHRIGALTNEAARQRFNVAVSRAQDQLWLFHTAQLDTLSSACMRHRLLSYMLDPQRQATAESEQRFDSEFERHVYQCIAARGFHVRTQVCVGDPTNHRYRIDLVVEGMQGRLAVECDGDEWHGPDRYEQDMSRQRDLERAGWRFARIRGGDFYRDPEKAMVPVWGELDRLGIQPGGIDASAAQPPQPKSMELDERLDAALEEDPSGEPPPPESGGPPSSGEAASTETQRLEEVAPMAAASSRADPPTAQGLAQLREADEPTSDILPLFTNLGPVTRVHPRGVPYIAFEGPAGPDPRESTPAEIAEGLCRIIETEGPVLAKRAYDVYLRGCGIRRMGNELRRFMNKALQHAIRTGRVAKEDEAGKGGLVYSIVRSTDAPAVVLRQRGPRDFEEIPPSELQLAARQLSRETGFESASDVHLRAVLEFFDLKRLTVQVGTRLLDVLDRSYPYVDAALDGKRWTP